MCTKNLGWTWDYRPSCFYVILNLWQFEFYVFELSLNCHLRTYQECKKFSFCINFVQKPGNIFIFFCYSTADWSSYCHSRSRVAWWDMFGWGIHPHHPFHSRGLWLHRETFDELLPTSTGSIRYCNQPSGSYSSKRNGDGKLLACFEK